MAYHSHLFTPNLDGISAIFILSAASAWNQSQPKKTDYLCADFKRYLPRRLCAERR